ncbi:molecular chaperone TorD family protein [Shewanella mesophila]|uniref:TorD/DmsD family molecular chaperone n=1 Tax=Shewanella mesophila TaxID=2864208 RepID=UPI001C65BC64|nr:molecular chaperone TorD family protein [Shewanella mesophila]QYJ86920.1 molecular chaperone TorD family protein [Shewanella mesophila]
MNNEKLQDIQAIANVMHSVLTVYPESDLINTFKSNSIGESWPRLSNTDRERVGLEHLISYIESWANNEQEIIQLKLDYGNLFYGPGTPIAPPWGSSYTSASLLLNDSSTKELQEFYAAHNINIAMKSNEPIDHIGLIMAVLAFLFEKLQKQSEDERLKKVITELLAEHLLPWGDRCLELAYLNAETEYFKGISLIGRDFLLYIRDLFNVTPRAVAIYR